jgi:hypothetical protein
MIQDHEGVELQVRQTAVLRDADGKASTPTRRSIGTWPGSRKTAPLLCSLCPVVNVRASLAASTTRTMSSVRCGATRSSVAPDRARWRASDTCCTAMSPDGWLWLALVLLDRRLVSSCTDGEVP